MTIAEGIRKTELTAENRDINGRITLLEFRQSQPYANSIIQRVGLSITWRRNVF